MTAAPIGMIDAQMKIHGSAARKAAKAITNSSRKNNPQLFFVISVLSYRNDPDRTTAVPTEIPFPLRHLGPDMQTTDTSLRFA